MAVEVHAPEPASQSDQQASSVTLLLLVYGPDGIPKTEYSYVNEIHILFLITLNLLQN